MSGSVRLHATTAFADDSANDLTGALGRDWFFQGTEDLIGDGELNGRESVTPLV